MATETTLLPIPAHGDVIDPGDDLGLAKMWQVTIPASFPVIGGLSALGDTMAEARENLARIILTESPDFTAFVAENGGDLNELRVRIMVTTGKSFFASQFQD